MEIHICCLSVTFVVVFLNLCECSIDLLFSHQCRHEVPKPNDVQFGVKLEPYHVMRKRSIDQPLRIHLVYDASLDALPNDKQQLVKNDLIPAAVDYWQQALQVRHTGGPIRLLRQCNSDRVRYRNNDTLPYCVDGCSNYTHCGDVIVPVDHLGSCHEAPIGGKFRVTGTEGRGITNKDFVLYVSAKAIHRCFIGSTVAYAAYCQLESALDRPVAGYVNLCPESVSTRPHDIHQMHSTIKHEILHALGFSAGLFAFYRDANGEPLTPRMKATGRPLYNYTMHLYQWSDRVVRTVIRPDWKVRSGHVPKTAHMVVTPAVTAEVRQHFNCSSLEGAELEDQGVNGTMLTHWEKRVFENEMMTGTYTQNPAISRVTLALMEDTGWYRVNYAMADVYHWGQDLGCNFVTKSCMHWMSLRQQRGESVHPYCERVKDGGLQTECTQQRDALALCNLIDYGKTLPAQYQHFASIDGVAESDIANYAGAVVLADYCPYVQEFSWKKDEMIVRGSRCHIAENSADAEINYALEKYGTDSMCFEHGSAWTVQSCDRIYPVEHWGSGCYQYHCSSTTGLTIMTSDGPVLQCLYTGQKLHVAVVTKEWLHQGSILCPACDEICNKYGETPMSDDAEEEMMFSKYGVHDVAVFQRDGVQCPSVVTPINTTEQMSDLTAPCSASKLSHVVGSLLTVLMFVFSLSSTSCQYVR